ncbi:MAG: ATP-binding cassette domain-containing protein [Treponema sp.]|jgi:ATP-binding cassette subfamily F protein 3|nr:ATP-binding cassette domain-containing protein [Treponema sp.]
MAFVQFSRVSLAFGCRDILKDVSLNLAAGSRASLAGANGSGKSTLMKVIAGLLAADSGDRAVEKGTRISYLPQSGIVHRGKTLREEIEGAFSAVTDMTARMEGLGRELEGVKEDGGRTAALLDEYHRLEEAVERSGYYRRDAVISQVLSGLGFSEDDASRNTGEFSGGWQMRIALAKALLEAPDILLLDEPTNYLDIEARNWLEDHLVNFRGGYLLVSHDRYFLDLTVNEVYELFQGGLKRYAGNYTAYEKTREQELAGLMKRYAAQQEEIARTEALIRRFRYKASKAAMVQERIRMLEKMERIEIPESLKKISISFPPPPRSGRVALTLEGAGKSYGEKRVFSTLDLVLESGERLVVAGRNGAGKSTLLRIIAGADRDYEGKVTYGAGVAAGYFSQESAEFLEGIPEGIPGGVSEGGAAGMPESSGASVMGDRASPQVIEFMEREAGMALIPKIRDMLGAFLFRGDDVYKPLSVLSGGEKSRLALLRILLKPVNLLVLDEPTNHLDLHSKDVLLDALAKFTGTIVFVSHDRSFMDALSTKTLELSSRNGDGSFSRGPVPRLFYGNYSYYLERLEREARADSPDAAPSPPRAEPAGGRRAPEPGPLSGQDRREREKQRQALLRRLQRQEGEILAALEALEAEKAGLEAELSRPEVYSNGEKARAVKLKLDGIAGAIEGKTGEWEDTAALLAEAGFSCGHSPSLLV